LRQLGRCFTTGGMRCRRLPYTLACRCLVACFAVALTLAASPARAVFHIAHISELMTSYGGSADVQFVEITMETIGQNLVSASKLNVFDANGQFVGTVLTVPSNVQSGSGRPWIMGTPAFEIASGIAVDFEFANASLPVGAGMVCWGKPGTSPQPVSCPVSGVPYVDCVAYGNYTGPSNACIGTPTPLTPVGHSLRRVTDTHDNAQDFACADPADPENNARAKATMAATVSCVVTTTTTLPTTTLAPTTTLPPTTLPATTTTLASGDCGDANGDSAITALDALIALRTAVGASSCPRSVCDVDSSGSVSSSDALRILRVAVGGSLALNCA
jgi:hypothetical protein